MTRTILAILLVGTITGAVDAQQESAIPSPRPAPIATTSVNSTADETIEIKYGMQRHRVIDLVGTPSINSLINSLQRARIRYDDETTMLFEDNRLISISTPLELEDLGEGRVSVSRAGKSLVFDRSLLLPEPQRLPVGDERLAISNDFFYGGSTGNGDEFPVHFTPATPQCLLDNCPDCEACSEDGFVEIGINDHGGVGCISNALLGYGGNWNLRAMADAIFLHRGADDVTYLAQAGGTTVGTTPLSQGLTPGLNTAATFNLTGTTYLEAGYLGLHEWSAESSSGNLLSSPDSLSSTGRYEANLHDLQLNMIHFRLDTNWTLLWGVRYSQQKDSFAGSLTGSFDPGSGPVAVDLPLRSIAKNDLLGLQVGSEHWWACGNMELVASVKGGVFHNQIEQQGPSYSGSIDLASTPISTPVFDRDDEDVSFMADFEVLGRYSITSCAAVRIGYRGIVWSDIAMIANQNGQSATPGTLWYNGVFAGLELRR
ncbi:MAG: hypothetical protein P8L85_12810 [Rubripirellula sp.]|nr:hypothetical protein [Rubripirellula sp.]